MPSILPEDQSLVFRSSVGWHKPSVTLIPGALTPSSGPMDILTQMEGIQRDTHADT